VKPKKQRKGGQARPIKTPAANLSAHQKARHLICEGPGNLTTGPVPAPRFKTYTAKRARAQFERLLADVAAGCVVEITQRGKAVASMLRPATLEWRFEVGKLRGRKLVPKFEEVRTVKPTLYKGVFMMPGEVDLDRLAEEIQAARTDTAHQPAKKKPGQ
jgi:antitoxin (DNA-binding transcriptional repressor) of toxin-antitoxin stability system